MDSADRIARAVLYEGYLLWPYRRSALKNQRRWTFGGVFPEGHSRRHPDDRWRMRTECLILADPDATVDVHVRFLQVVERAVCAIGDAGALERVDELTAGGERHLAWEEVTEREIHADGLRLEWLAGGHHVPIAVSGGEDVEELSEEGRPVGALVRSWAALQGLVVLSAERIGDGLHRLAVTICNTTPWEGGDRQAAQRLAFCSTHTVLRSAQGRFASLTDPPARLREAAAACRNDGTWPVLAGDPPPPGADLVGDTLLSSPIILEDHPRIAAESPGDLFDGGEIDQLLTLSILSLTDEEKAEMRDTDPRAREILERTEALTSEQLMRLHGQMRDLREIGRR